MVKLLRYLLLPISLLYGFVVVIRNKFFDWGIYKTVQFNKPVICVGNLAVGGSGKTPVVEYLVRLLEGKRIAILSRGYGRKTKGFILADANATALTIGDEPLQYYHKFANITVAVCEDRVFGIGQLINNHDVVLLDDAFQHRHVRAGLNILLFDYSKILKRQFLLPAGDLREPFYGYKRAGQILVTKCPPKVQESVVLDKFSKDIPVAFSSISYDQLTPVFKDEERVLTENSDVFLLTGIANPSPLVGYITQTAKIIKHFEYPDHYAFKPNDIKKLVKEFENANVENKIIVTTEKDAQRLVAVALKDLLLHLPVYYLPIKINLNTADRLKFDRKILDYVAKA